MAITKLYDLAVKTGEYTTSNGDKKGRWQNVGSIMQKDDGSEFIMLSKWFNPAGVPDLSGKGGDSILLSKFDPRHKDGDQQSTTSGGRQPKSVDDLVDDIPF